MSMQSSFVYGFGFEVKNITDENLLDFIKHHKDEFCTSEDEIELFKNIPMHCDLKEYFEDYPCETSGHEGFGAVISNVILRETGIGVEYQMGQEECYSYPSVLLKKCMPWDLKEKEKILTKESLTEILTPYVKELGLKKQDIGFLEIEYYG